MDRWDGMFTAALRSHLSTCLYGFPLLREAGHSLAVLTAFTRGRRYLGNVIYDVAKNAVCGLGPKPGHRPRASRHAAEPRRHGARS
jgi:hypothetical protein